MKILTMQSVESCLVIIYKDFLNFATNLMVTELIINMCIQEALTDWVKTLYKLYDT